MRDSYKRVIAVLGAQAAAFVLVLLLGGFANLGTIPAAPPKTDIRLVPVPHVSTKYVTVTPTPGRSSGTVNARTATPSPSPGTASGASAGHAPAGSPSTSASVSGEHS